MAETAQEKKRGGVIVRFFVLYAISFVAFGLAEPTRGNAFVAGGAVVPAIIAWLLVRKKPFGLGRAIIRGASIILIFAGFVALGSAPAGESVDKMSGVAGLTLTIWADAFLVIGLIGLFGSFVGERHQKNPDSGAAA